jgi:predicted metal-dependent hydrolase
MVPQNHFQKGLLLFNSARFFEAHEALEDVWRAAPRRTRLRRHLQGLVQLAVAFHHQSTGNPLGAGSVLERALRNLDGAEESFPDLDLKSLHASLTPWREHLPRTHPWRPSSSSQAHHLSDPELPKIMLRDQPR